MAYTFQEIYNYFQEYGCTLTVQEYKNSKERMTFICSCGLEGYKSFETFKRAKHCSECGKKKRAKNNVTLGFDEVSEYFKEQGCELLEKEYKGIKYKMKYRCICGEASKVSFETFRNGTRCKSCMGKRISLSKSYSYDEVKQVFENSNCKLISPEYNGNSVKLDFKCKCGKIEKLTLKQFNKYKSCRRCSNVYSYDFSDIKFYFKINNCTLITNSIESIYDELEYQCHCEKIDRTSFFKYKHSKHKSCSWCVKEFMVKNRAFSYDFVRRFFKENNCALLSDKYTNCSESLSYICECGNKSNITFTSFKNGHRCKDCGISKLSNKIRKPFEEVKKVFEDNQCILLSENYINKSVPLKYMCSCGNIEEKRFDSFRDYPHCSKCKSKYFSSIRKGKELFGSKREKHHNWNPDKTDEERENDRSVSELKIWRNRVYERDCYTCQCCGDNKGGNLNAHHLDGYDWCKGSRFEIENGITLCHICHKDFHSIFGYGHNYREQFEEYMIGISWNHSISM